MSCHKNSRVAIAIYVSVLILASCTDNQRTTVLQDVKRSPIDALDIELRVMDQTRDMYDVKQGALRVSCSPMPAPARLDDFFASKEENNRVLARAALRDPSIIDGKSKAVSDYCISRFTLLPEPKTAAIFMDIIAFNASTMTPEVRRGLLPYAGVYLNNETVVAQDVKSGEAVTVRGRAMRLIGRLAAPDQLIEKDTKLEDQKNIDVVNAYLVKLFGDRVERLRSTARWNMP